MPIALRTAAATAACCLLSCAALAQALPENWRARALEGGTLYEPTDLPTGSRFELWAAPAAPVGGGGDPAKQLADAVAAGGLRGLDAAGAAPACGPATVSQGSATMDCRLAPAGRPVISLKYVMLPPREGRARWLRIAAMGNPDLLERYAAGFKRVLALAVDDGATAAAPPPQATVAAQPGKPPSAQDIRQAIQARPGAGVQPGQVETVLFSWDQVYRVTGLQYEETIYLLLKDGSAYEGLALAPEDFDAEASRRLQPRRWVRWRKAGGDWQVMAQGGSQWKKLKAWPAVPGKPDERLKGTFSHHAYTSMGGLGGSAHVNSFQFAPDGSYERFGHSSYGTGVIQAGNGYAGGATSTYSRRGTTSTSSVSAGGDGLGGTPAAAGGSTTHRDDGAANVGSYRVDGWRIELRRGDGAVERRLFLFTSDKRDAINVGGVGYSLPRR